jgi:hypothetical protein
VAKRQRQNRLTEAVCVEGKGQLTCWVRRASSEG